ncbi:MAG: tetratricopeptide repeat protein [Planctomycetes bacterium]|nr:tetratricopeptide repeat protein [Planctomycetota bacterium]
MLFLIPVAFLAGCASAPPPLPMKIQRREADEEFLRANYSQAARLYQDLLKQAEPAEAAALWAQIGKCRLGTGEYMPAIAAFDEALELPAPEPLRMEIHYRRGLAYNACWRPQMAIADFRRVQQAPKDAREEAVKKEEFQFRLAVTLMRVGEWAEGRRLLEEVVKDHPTSEEAAQARDRLPLDHHRIQIARCGSDNVARGLAQAAIAKGLPAEVMNSGAAPSERLVVVGRFARFEDALRELERVRSMGYADAFLIP